jgi:hypothetical protein
MQLVPSQIVPVSHGSSRQHGSPALPQLVHVPPSQRPSKHDPSPQQAPPSMPQSQGIGMLGSQVSHGGAVPGWLTHAPSMHSSSPLQKSPSSQGPATGVRSHRFDTQWTSRHGSSSLQFASEKHSRLAARTQRSPTQLKPSGQTPSGHEYQASRSSGVHAARMESHAIVTLEARVVAAMRPDPTSGA